MPMLHHEVDNVMTVSHRERTVSRIKLHDDSWAGKNKNSVLLMYLCWRSVVRFYDKNDLALMVAGHVKAVVDGAFSHVKHRLKTTDIRASREMIKVVQNSSSSNYCVPSAELV